MSIEKDIFQRTELLLGKRFIEKAAEKKVIIFGIGGVGSWCAESLVRSGIVQLTIVDSDLVSLSNVNRQLLATTKTVGKIKTEVLKERLLEINPVAKIIAIQKVYCSETSDSFELEGYDFIIDAIDSLSNKIHLIQTATATNATFFSSMGAALKMDPTRIKAAEFWKVQGCRLGAVLRKQMKRDGIILKPFMCVYSDEILANNSSDIDPTQALMTDNQSDELQADNWSHKKARINGTTSYMPAMFGMTISSLVIKKIHADL
jgi:tRNA A37 threonylcarbamoyladenosine dehydratase